MQIAELVRGASTELLWIPEQSPEDVSFRRIFLALRWSTAPSPGLEGITGSERPSRDYDVWLVF